MNNRIGVYYGYFVETDELLWEDYALRAKTAGADSIEMSALTLSLLPESRLRRIADCVKDLDMELIFADALLPGCDFCSDDPEPRRRASEQLTAHLALAETMGVRKIGGILETQGKSFPAGIAFSREERLNNAVGPLRAIGDMAADKGIVLGIEAVNRFECALINTVGEGLRFIGAVGSEGIRLLADTFHMNIEEADPAEAIRRAGPALCHIHLAENDRSLPGNGHIDWPGILRAVRDAGYRGSLVIESIAKPFGQFAGRLNIWRSHVRQGMDEDLKASIAYLKALEAAVGQEPDPGREAYK